MSQANMVPNGVPPQFRPQLNGKESTHSSASSSPSSQMYNKIPPTQLPPSRIVPSAQLPPSTRPLYPSLNQLTQNLNLVSNITPSSSPKKQTFGTSTPIQDAAVEQPKVSENLLMKSGLNVNFNQSNVLSPITLQNQQQATTTAGFTHSANSQFSNVPNPAVRESNQSPFAQINTQSNGAQSVASHINSANVPCNQFQQQPTQYPPNQQLQSNGSNLIHQHSLPSTALPPRPGPAPALIQPSLSQPRLMGYMQNPQAANIAQHTQNVSRVTQGVTTQMSQINQPQQNFPLSQNQMKSAPTTINPTGTAINYNFINAQAMPPQVNQNQFQQPPIQLPALSQNQSKLPINLGTMPAVGQQRPINSLAMSQNTFQQPPLINTQVGGVASQNQFQPPINSQTGPMTYQPPINSQTRPGMMNQNQFPQAPINAQAGGGYPNQMPPQIAASQNQPNRPPNLLSHQQSTPNLYNHQMPPKTNSLPGPQDLIGGNQMKTNVHSNRYPIVPQAAVAQTYSNQPPVQPNLQPNVQQHYQQPYQNQPYPNQQTTPRGPVSVTQSGFNKLWGAESFDLMQTPQILPETKVETPKINLGNQLMDQANCSPDIFRCTMTKIPETSSLLQKSRLPLGVLIHPFRDLNHLPVIQCNSIVRCRACRTYINPFVFFVDSKRWKCNLCYRVNELPEEFQYDPVSKSYGDPSRRPEVKASTIEYIAPAEYMLRPPQPAVYLYLLDISRNAIESGYLHTMCATLSAELPNLPGDARTHIGFIAYDSALHFFSMADGLSQPHEMTVLDIEDIFLPMPDNLLCNLQDRMELVSDLLAQLPNRYNHSYDTGSALGAALQAAHKMMAGTGGRVTVFQASLPTLGPGALISREDPSQRAASEAPHLNPANDFYKRLALECSGQQIAVDLFLVNSQYVDLATLSGISRFSGGCIYHFPLFKATRFMQNESFERTFKRYLSRKIGFEAVMRIRCTRGLAIHTFHGNFFVRSTDLLSLPNINPDAGFGMQVAIEESLSDVQTVCFQAALLYTSSKGERRIRVHTMCLPVVATLSDVINSADQQCIIGLLAKMAVDRSMHTSLADAREAFINVAIDILTSYKLSQNMGSAGATGLLTPRCLILLPLYISALLKNAAFRIGISTRLDDRVKAMCDMKTKPLPYLIQQIYPDLYPVHNLETQPTIVNEEEEAVPAPPRLQLTARSVDSNGAYLLDLGEHMVLVVCASVSALFLNQVLGVADYNQVTDQMYELPVLENEYNQRLHMFVNYLNDEKPMNATIQIIRENSPQRTVFIDKLIEDRVESALSYHEFLQHLKTQVK